MKNHLTLFLLLAIGFFSCTPATTEAPLKEAPPAQERAAYAIAIHGGAGTILKKNMTPERESAYRAALNEALTIGETILKEGGSSMDAVVKTIEHLENSPLFNAGKGAVFTHEGRNELDASIMDGNTRNAGAIGGITIVKNPIKAARAVMENSPHVLLTGTGAESFAKEQGLEIVPNSYFYTENRWNSLQRAIEKEQSPTGMADQPIDSKFGTVGCAALDKEGNLAAGTSTGGMTNKRYNRIGDSPIIGAGTYANNASCAVSCTGHGEYFIRYAVAYDLSARMEYAGESLQDAADHIIHKKLKEAGGNGGFIAVDKWGNVAMPFNTEGMYRAYAKPGKRAIKIYDEAQEGQ
jgi:beta-aspartyl-peptidase (threonine type)